MARVQVELGSWFGERLSPDHPRRLLLREEIKEGQAFVMLLNNLATKYEAFGEVIFNRESQELYDHVLVIVNGRLLRLSTQGDIRLQDGDQIAFYPVYAGG